MKFFIFGLCIFAAYGDPVDICFPEPIHSFISVVETHRDHESEHISLITYHDATAKKILVRYSEDHRRHEHHAAELLDYNKKYRYHWEYHNKTAHHCTITRIEGDIKPTCIAEKANKTAEFIMGEDYKVEAYQARIERSGYWADIDVVVEAGSTTKIVQSYERGGGHTHFFAEAQNIYDLSTKAIPADTFAVPDDCPH